MSSREASTTPAHQEDQRHVEFLAGADLVIHDAQYTIDEYAGKIGWGHSPAEWAVDYALAGDVKRLALFHHDPLRDDEAWIAWWRHAGSASKRPEAGWRCLPPRRGRSWSWSGAWPGAALRAPPATAAVPADAGREPLTILIADDDPTVVKILVATLRRRLPALDGTRRQGGSAHGARRTAGADPAGLAHAGPGGSGGHPRPAGGRGPVLREVPVVLITAETGPENTAAGFAAGVTDYLTKPFTPPLVRARVRAWLARRGAATGSSA